MGVSNTYMDEKGTKKCKHLGKKYPEECYGCKHYVSIVCGCDYEYNYGEGLGVMGGMSQGE